MTPKQKLFVAEYLIDLNATEAAIRAGYSSKTAKQIGAENLTKPVITGAIAEAMAEREKRTVISQDYVLNALRVEAEFRGEGSTHGGRVRALELLGKHVGMFASTLQVRGDPGNPLLMEHTGTVSLCDRIDLYAEAFEAVVRREETGNPDAVEGDDIPQNRIPQDGD